jgi:hypothetical protein
MPTFDDRRDAYEQRFAHDEDLRFKAMARRNTLFGLWAAQKGVVAALKAAAGVTALVSGVYDEVPQGQVYPYLAVLHGREVPDNTFGLDGHAVEIDLQACTQDGSPTTASSGSIR